MALYKNKEESWIKLSIIVDLQCVDLQCDYHFLDRLDNISSSSYLLLWIKR